MTIPIVDSPEGHAAAFVCVRETWLAEEGTDAAAEREALINLIRIYKERTDPWPDLPPQEIVRGIMEPRGLSQQDLVPVFGSKSQVSDFLSDRRGLTANQAVRVRQAYNVPLDLLLRII